MRNPAGSLPGTAPGLSRDVRARLTRLAQANPEWRAALASLGTALEVLGGPAFATLTRSTAAGIPRLAGATITVSSEALGPLFDRLAVAAGEGPGLGARHSALGGPAAQLERALRETEEVSPVARLVAMIVLTQCARTLPREQAGWIGSSCPVCAAWPLLGETRGLERIRWLRCGQCGADWRGELLRCIYCGERDHARLGTLIPEGVTGGPAVETCASCRGYLKTVTTLGPLDHAELLLTDFETIELDLAAREAGFTRPAGLGTLDITVMGS